MFTLRWYQERAKIAMKEFIDSKSKKAIIVHPTGTGKSLLTAIFAKYSDKPTLVLQPSKELLEQNYKKALMLGLEPAVFSASMNRKEIGDLIYATPGSVANAPHLFKHIDHVIIDECHMKVTRKLHKGKISGKSEVEKVLELIDYKKCLGLTATPILLIPAITGSKIQMINRTKRSFFNQAPIIDMLQIKDIKDEFWHNIKVKTRKAYDASKLILNKTGNDFTEDSIVEAFEMNGGVEALFDNVQDILKVKGIDRVLVFAPSLKTAHDLCKKAPGIEVISGDTKASDRSRIVEEFQKGKIKVLVNYGVLTTGYDDPDLPAIINARDTNSFGLFYQIFGRIVRPSQNIKGDKLFLDLSSNTERFGVVGDITFEESEYTGGWAMLKGDRVMTGVPLMEIDNYPTLKEFKDLMEEKKKKYFVESPLDKKDPVFYFGKFKGKKFSEVARKNGWYIEYLAKNKDFKYYGKNGLDLKEAVREYVIKKAMNHNDK